MVFSTGAEVSGAANPVASAEDGVGFTGTDDPAFPPVVEAPAGPAGAVDGDVPPFFAAGAFGVVLVAAPLDVDPPVDAGFFDFDFDLVLALAMDLDFDFALVLAWEVVLAFALDFEEALAEDAALFDFVAPECVVALVEDGVFLGFVWPAAPVVPAAGEDVAAEDTAPGTADEAEGPACSA